VVVADVDCTEEQDLCSDYDVKGYPTIKYWKAGESPDKGTDYQGGRTFDDLKKFVEDELEVKCLLSDPSGCTDKETEFMAKWKGKSKEDVAAQLERLDKMMGSKMTPDLKKWLVQRINVLKQIKEA
jgi:protein disulfide-isomerase A6